MDSVAARRNVRLLYAFWFLRDFHLWIPVWIVFLTIERGFSLTQVTSAEGLFLLGVLALEVPTGAVADRWGRSLSLALGALALGVSVLIFAFTTTFGVLLVSFMLWSVAATLMSGADTALLFDTLKAAGRTESYERIAGRGHALSWTGAGIGTFLGGPVAALTDIRTTIIIGAATCLVTAIMALLMKEPPRERSEHARYAKAIRSAFSEAWRTVDVRRVILFAGFAIAALEGVQYLVQPYLVDRDIEVGVWFSLLQVPTIVAGIFGALMAERIKGRGGLIAALVGIPLIGGLSYLSLALVPGLWAYATLPLMFGLWSCLMPLTTGYINRRVGSQNRATILSFQGMVTSVVLAGIAPGFGFITDRWGIEWAFAAGGALTLGALLLFRKPSDEAAGGPIPEPVAAATPVGAPGS